MDRAATERPEDVGPCAGLVGATGFVLLTPLPDQRWIMFVTNGEGDTSPDPLRPDQVVRS